MDIELEFPELVRAGLHASRDDRRSVMDCAAGLGSRVVIQDPAEVACERVELRMPPPKVMLMENELQVKAISHSRLSPDHARLHNGLVDALIVFGEHADGCRAAALKCKPGTERRKGWLTSCRIWALAEARLQGLLERRVVEPDYKRVRGGHPPF